MTTDRYSIAYTLLLIGCSLNICIAQNNYTPQQKAIMDIQKSHLDANIPEQSVFNKFLARDLKKYFQPSLGEVVAKWDFLREGPTQIGVAYPKYYLWIKTFKGSKLISEGAARVEAIDKKRFEVTDFVTTKQIKANIPDIYTVFPGQVCEKIKSKI